MTDQRPGRWPPELGDEQQVIDAFHRLWYEQRQRQTWRATTFLGVSTQQAPTDLWVYQEILFDTRPDTVIEVGVKKGGTTLWFATLLDQLGQGRVVGVDIDLRVADAVDQHPRVRLIEGDATSAETFERVRREIDGRTMVLLDSDHTAAHVARELQLYAPLVTPGCYVIVNDTNIGGHPALPEKESSPWDAVEAFVQGESGFTIDTAREKHMLTLSPHGFLLRQ